MHRVFLYTLNTIDFKVAMEILHALFDEMESFTNTNFVLGLRFQRLLTREGAIECQSH